MEYMWRIKEGGFDFYLIWVERGNSEEVKNIGPHGPFWLTVGQPDGENDFVQKIMYQ